MSTDTVIDEHAAASGDALRAFFEGAAVHCHTPRPSQPQDDDEDEEEENDRGSSGGGNIDPDDEEGDYDDDDEGGDETLWTRRLRRGLSCGRRPESTFLKCHIAPGIARPVS
jgi:hypothetical protein